VFEKIPVHKIRRIVVRTHKPILIISAQSVKGAIRPIFSEMPVTTHQPRLLFLRFPLVSNSHQS
jgi:hypothetical protein